MDDEIIHAGSEIKAWAAAHQVATREAYLSIQDAVWKRRPKYQSGGAWAGSLISTNDTDI